MQRPMMMMMLPLLACLQTAAAAEPADLPAAVTDEVARWNAAGRAAAAARPAAFARPGVQADRDARRVTVLAVSCGLKPLETAEFLIIGPTSDRGYEALTQAFATPGDVAAALEFIGLPRGQNIDPAQMRFWSRGERVRISVQLATNLATRRPLESYVLDRRRNAALPAAGFVYCGSVWTGRAERAVCLADLARADGTRPQSILSTYNDPITVLDVPRQAAQGDVYETYVANPGQMLPTHVLLLLEFTPETRPADAAPRVLPLAVTARPAGAASNAAAFTLQAHGAPPETLASLPALLARLRRETTQARDPYVTLTFDESLTLGEAVTVAAALRLVEGEDGIRVEPPPPGQCYYRSFLPDDAWRQRAGRPSQPWELHLTRGEGAAPWQFKLVRTLEDWSDPASLDPRLTVKEYPLASLDELPLLIQKLGGGPPVLLLFAPLDAPLRLFLPAVRLLHATQPVVYFFGLPPPGSPLKPEGTE